MACDPNVQHLPGGKVTYPTYPPIWCCFFRLIYGLAYRMSSILGNLTCGIGKPCVTAPINGWGGRLDIDSPFHFWWL